MKLRLFFRQVELVDQEHWDLIKDEFSIEKKKSYFEAIKRLQQLQREQNRSQFKVFKSRSAVCSGFDPEAAG